MADWMPLERLIVAIQQSLSKAEKMLDKRDKSASLIYAVTDFKLKLPVESEVDKRGTVFVRTPDFRSSDSEKLSDVGLSHVEVTLRPVPNLEEATARPGASRENPGAPAEEK